MLPDRPRSESCAPASPMFTAARPAIPWVPIHSFFVLTSTVGVVISIAASSHSVVLIVNVFALVTNAISIPMRVHLDRNLNPT